MTSIATGIITAPRPVATLTRSVETFLVAGFTRAVVFAEPGSADCEYPHVEMRKSDMRKGNFRNWVSALATLEREFMDEWLMICEDDIRWSENGHFDLAEDLLAWRNDGRVGAISLYLPNRMGKVIEKEHGGRLTAGYYHANLGRSTWGAQALVFHRNWAKRLLVHPAMKAYLDDPRWDKNVDALVADVIARMNMSIAYRVPCLVDHTFGDANSSLGYKPDRPDLKTKYFEE